MKRYHTWFIDINLNINRFDFIPIICGNCITNNTINNNNDKKPKMFHLFDRKKCEISRKVKGIFRYHGLNSMRNVYVNMTRNVYPYQREIYVGPILHKISYEKLKSIINADDTCIINKTRQYRGLMIQGMNEDRIKKAEIVLQEKLLKV